MTQASPAVAARRRFWDRSLPQGGQSGAALLTVLVMVAILGLTAGVAGQSLRAMMQRECEAELLWRGQQYRQAIASYYNVKHGPQQMYPAKLDDLLKDPRMPGVVRHLRRLYDDPMTGKKWEPVKDPAEKLIGVRSTSPLEPFQQAGFPKGLETLEGKTSYREWEFVYVPPRKSEQKPGSGAGSTPKGGAASRIPPRTAHP
ncbi:MAG: type II secretion system protein [Deltaproteobacteria bacterium]|nr:MAG: type II secretion system protein [Deltaproteobacteria bacterium]